MGSDANKEASSFTARGGSGRVSQTPVSALPGPPISSSNLANRLASEVGPARFSVIVWRMDALLSTMNFSSAAGVGTFFWETLNSTVETFPPEEVFDSAAGDVNASNAPLC